MKKSGVIDKGMIPKVDSAVAALRAGVEKSPSWMDGWPMRCFWKCSRRSRWERKLCCEGEPPPERMSRLKGALSAPAMCTESLMFGKILPQTGRGCLTQRRKDTARESRNQNNSTTDFPDFTDLKLV